MELESTLLSGRTEERFAAEDKSEGSSVEFFSRTQEFDGRRKGLVEVEL